MGESLPQITRALASDMMDLEPVGEIINHNGSTGKVAFRIEQKALSAGTIERLLPDGWTLHLVATPNDYTSVFIHRDV